MNKKIASKIVLFASVALLAAGCHKTNTAQQDTNTTTTMQQTPDTTGSANPTTTMPATATSTTVTASTSLTTIPAVTNLSVKSFTVTGKDFSFSPSEIKVNKGDMVKIAFNNADGFHDFVLDAFNVRTSRIQSGKSETVQFVADKAGTFEYYCSVGSHRQMGMKGNLIVQ